jgi:chromosome segregation ATPase
MDSNITTADIVLAFVAVGGLASSIVQFILTARDRKATASAQDADAIESLTASVSRLYSRIDELQSELDKERIARRMAENKLQDLTRRIVVLENENTSLRLENEALKGALEELTNDND